MVITKIWPKFILFCIALTSIFSTCKKGGTGCANPIYNFQISAIIYPDKDSIHIGDTIWLAINSATSFRDTISNQTIDYSGAGNLGTAIGFGEYSIVNNPVVAANSFSDVLITGGKVNNPDVEKVREYLFSEQNNRYLFKLGIVSKQTGIFGIGLSNATNVYRISDKCTKANFQINVENTHQHYYLNPNITSSNFDTTQPSGTYYFKVIN